MSGYGTVRRANNDKKYVAELQNILTESERRGYRMTAGNPEHRKLFKIMTCIRVRDAKGQPVPEQMRILAGRIMALPTKFEKNGTDTRKYVKELRGILNRCQISGHRPLAMSDDYNAVRKVMADVDNRRATNRDILPDILHLLDQIQSLPTKQQKRARQNNGDMAMSRADFAKKLERTAAACPNVRLIRCVFGHKSLDRVIFAYRNDKLAHLLSECLEWILSHEVKGTRARNMLREYVGMGIINPDAPTAYHICKDVESGVMPIPKTQMLNPDTPSVMRLANRAGVSTKRIYQVFSEAHGVGRQYAGLIDAYVNGDAESMINAMPAHVADILKYRYGMNLVGTDVEKIKKAGEWFLWNFRSDSIKESTDWQTVDDLRTFYLRGTRGAIVRYLYELAQGMGPDAIRIDDGPNPYLLNAAFVPMFSKCSSIPEYDKETKAHLKGYDWLDASDLCEFFFGTRQKIEFALYRLFASGHKDKVQIRYMQNSKNLCVHRDNLDWVAKMTGLTRRQKTPVKQLHGTINQKVK